MAGRHGVRPLPFASSARVPHATLRGGKMQGLTPRDVLLTPRDVLQLARASPKGIRPERLRDCHPPRGSRTGSLRVLSFPRRQAYPRGYRDRDSRPVLEQPLEHSCEVVTMIPGLCHERLTPRSGRAGTQLAKLDDAVRRVPCTVTLGTWALEPERTGLIGNRSHYPKASCRGRRLSPAIRCSRSATPQAFRVTGQSTSRTLRSRWPCLKNQRIWCS